jgi:hypothetical protein
MMVLQGGRCGIYGANCSEWIIAMEVLQSLSIASFNKVHTHFSCYIYLENKLDLIWTLNIFETSKAHCVFFLHIFSSYLVCLTISIIPVQACNAHGIYCVPLYDTLGMYYTVLLTLQVWLCVN